MSEGGLDRMSYAKLRGIGWLMAADFVLSVAEIEFFSPVSPLLIFISVVCNIGAMICFFRDFTKRAETDPLVPGWMDRPYMTGIMFVSIIVPMAGCIYLFWSAIMSAAG